MKALINLLEKCNGGQGLRICQVEPTELFEVIDPLFWVDCPDDIVAAENYYDLDDKSFKKITEWSEIPYDPWAPKRGPSSLPPTE